MSDKYYGKVEIENKTQFSKNFMIFLYLKFSNVGNGMRICEHGGRGVQGVGYGEQNSKNNKKFEYKIKIPYIIFNLITNIWTDQTRNKIIIYAALGAYG